VTPTRQGCRPDVLAAPLGAAQAVVASEATAPEDGQSPDGRACHGATPSDRLERSLPAGHVEVVPFRAVAAALRARDPTRVAL
jgi:hypothetical protein